VCCGLTRPVHALLCSNKGSIPKGRDERHHTNDRATPPTQRVPGNSGPPTDTATPWLHPGGASRSGAPPAGTTDHARPVHAAGRSPTTRRAPDRRSTTRTRHGHHRRASRRSPRALATPPLRASCCATGWPRADPAHRCSRTGRCSHVLDHPQPRDTRHPTKVPIWPPTSEQDRPGETSSTSEPG
jgi:hypothetical protein